MKKYDVVCPHCCGIFHETNGQFDANRPANGAMFQPKQHVIDAGWTCFPPYDTTEYANIACPSCEQPYVDSSGRVIRLLEASVIEGLERQQDLFATAYAEPVPVELPVEGVHPKTTEPEETVQALPLTLADLAEQMKRDAPKVRARKKRSE